MQQFELGLSPSREKQGEQQEIEHIVLGRQSSSVGAGDKGSEGKGSDDKYSNEEGSRIAFQPNFMNLDKADEVFESLMNKVDWQEESLWIAGQQRKVPRLIAWYGDSDAQYRYSGELHHPQPWFPELESIKQSLEVSLGQSFNSVLCNLYRNGQDSVGWHADDERELGEQPVIASLSLGASRTFQLKHKNKPNLRHKMSLSSGSLLVMQGTTQQFWLHQVPKEPKVSQARINLTFRKVITEK